MRGQNEFKPQVFQIARRNLGPRRQLFVSAVKNFLELHGPLSGTRFQAMNIARVRRKLYSMKKTSHFCQQQSLLLVPALLGLALLAPTQVSAGDSISLQDRLKARVQQSPKYQRNQLLFDLPLTYNHKVSHWIEYYQTRGKPWFSDWLQRGSRFVPMIQKELREMGLPQDLVYMVMIESGFDPNAKSTAEAVGPWQFIRATGSRYGLQTNWWLDERRDLKKSTLAAVRYLKDLHHEFGSWYLVAASYNMGEAGLRRQIQKNGTRDFWALCQKGALPAETMEYVPKILAAMMIAKSPGVYGFNNITKLDPIDYELVMAPGGLDLKSLADHLGITPKALRDLNAELVTGGVPDHIERHPIRVPRGSVALVGEFINHHFSPRTNLIAEARGDRKLADKIDNKIEAAVHDEKSTTTIR